MTEVYTVLRKVAPVLASEASSLACAHFKIPFALRLPTRAAELHPAERERAGMFADCGTAQFSPLATKAIHCSDKNLLVSFLKWQCTFTGLAVGYYDGILVKFPVSSVT